MYLVVQEQQQWVQNGLITSMFVLHHQASEVLKFDAWEKGYRYGRNGGKTLLLWGCENS